MKFIFSIALFFILPVHFLAQKADDILATATELTFTPGALNENVRKAYLSQNELVAQERKNSLATVVREILTEAEAKAAGTTADALIAAELKKAPMPTAAEIKTVFDANRAAFGERTLAQVQSQIVAFLKNNAEQNALKELVEKLKTKHKFVPGKDVNGSGLKPSDVLFTAAGRPYTAGEFDERFKAHFYDVLSEVYDETVYDLQNSIFSALVAQEARTRNIDTGDLIAVEVTNKLRDFSDEERAKLEEALQKKLSEKYSVKILLKEPEPVAHAVTADDDPVFGKASAPVTVIMFSDFQCSACSATHPVLKKLLAAYPDTVRLVVRDFPLESVHPNAFRSAIAANAARAQGKFFEYIDVLYANQSSLDDASLKKYAQELGLNQKQFELDLASENAAAEIRKDMADGVRFGASGTPTIFVNGVRVHHVSFDTLKRAVERASGRTASK